MMYEPRTYRQMVKPRGLQAFHVVHGETDLLLHAYSDLSRLAAESVARLRADLERYIAGHPRFGESFVPVPVDDTAPDIARRMAQAAEQAGVGPMAAVAGAVAEAVARELAEHSAEVIVENGGDTFVVGRRDRIAALWAGDDVPPVGLLLRGTSLPCAVATSSATIGPSVSLGHADAATVVAESGALADAVASVVGNAVRSSGDLESALDAGRAIQGVRGIVAVVDGHLAAWGEIEFVPLEVSGRMR